MTSGGPYNPETHRRWYERNRERKIAQVKARYHADPESHTAAKRRYRAANPLRIRAVNANYQAQRHGVLGKLTEQGIAARLEMWGWRCWQCGEPWEEIDHVLPLSRGGPNLAANIRPICGRCNKVQAARLMNETLGVI
jgi:5-methylcytosine-specific restriction endonuclease McrA